MAESYDEETSDRDVPKLFPQKLQRTRQLHLETSMQLWNLQTNEKTRAKRKLKGSTPEGSDPKDSPTTTTTTTTTEIYLLLIAFSLDHFFVKRKNKILNVYKFN